MKIEIRETKVDGLICITSLDERFYRRESDAKLFWASHWICNYVPKGKGYEQYLKSMGENADVYRDERGDMGARVHQAIDLIVTRKAKTGKGWVDIQTEEFSDSDGQHSALLNGEECEAVLSWVNWWKEVEESYAVEIIDWEQAGYNEDLGYAGTRDLRFKLEMKPDVRIELEKKKAKSRKENPEYEDLTGTWLIDYKTSKAIYLSHRAQLSSYRHFPGCEGDRMAILQVGYKLNRAGFKFTEISDVFHLFLAALEFFKDENADKRPHQFELPEHLII